VDADVISHELMMPDMIVYCQIVDAFGTGILDTDRRIDRSRLGALVFSQPDRRRQLESIIHPQVRRIMSEQVQSSSGPYCLMAVPLLIETGMQSEVDRVLVIDIDPQTQRDRLKHRNGFDDTRIDLILSAQLNREDRLCHADDIIDNNGTIESLAPQVIALDELYRREDLSRHD